MTIFKSFFEYSDPMATFLHERSDAYLPKVLPLGFGNAVQFSGSRITPRALPCMNDTIRLQPCIMRSWEGIIASGETHQAVPRTPP